MSKRIQAIYDGAVLRPAEPLTLAPNTEVWVTIEDAQPAAETPASFLKTARALKLEGPADWSCTK